MNDADEPVPGDLPGDGSDNDPAVSPEPFSPALDSMAGALAAASAQTNRELATEAAAYFRKLATLVGIQTEHLHEQREVSLAHLKLRRRTEWLKAATQLATLGVGVCLTAVLCAMLATAVQSQRVVVEAFEAPPALTSRGVTGKVVATMLLDQLLVLQDATHVDAGKRTLSDAWSNEIKVDVPQTSISVSDIDHVLKARFGNDIHIFGYLTQTEAGGLSLTVRGDGVLPKAFAGGPGDLQRLVVQAAAYIYGESQPALYAGYLEANNRSDDAVKFSINAYKHTHGAERAALMVNWANALGDSGKSPREVLALYDGALAINPALWDAYTNTIVTEQEMGNEEGAWQTCEALRRAAGGRPGRAPEANYNDCDALSQDLLAERAGAMMNANQFGGVGTGLHDITAATIALAEIGMHSVERARIPAQLAGANLQDGDAVSAADAHLVNGLLAAEEGNTTVALHELENYDAALANPQVAAGDFGASCSIAPLEQAAGHAAKADAILSSGGNFVDCLRFRGDVLDQRGDWAGAERAYAAGIALAPDLPAAYYSWGMALAHHGMIDDAVRQLAQAHRHGPHWADPLKAWGDLLAARGEWEAALAKYDAALAFAPAWPGLIQARKSAASHLF